MSLSSLMDPINWAHRFYFITAIEKCGFENGWGPIIEKTDFLTNAFLKTKFTLTETQCHTFYLQILAEFGDFRTYSDILTFPSQEIKDKIQKMRRSQLRHELLLTNNQIRYNNYVLQHNGIPIKLDCHMNWHRYPTENFIQPDPPNIFVNLISIAPEIPFFPYEIKENLIIKKKMSFDIIISRCVNGAVSNAMELLRDIIHLYTNLILSPLNENELIAVKQMKNYYIDILLPYLEKDQRWDQIKDFII